jgi:hypothetical protein
MFFGTVIVSQLSFSIKWTKNRAWFLNAKLKLKAADIMIEDKNGKTGLFCQIK